MFDPHCHAIAPYFPGPYPNKGGVTAIYGHPRSPPPPGHPHFQNLSDMGIQSNPNPNRYVLEMGMPISLTAAKTIASHADEPL